MRFYLQWCDSVFDLSRHIISFFRYFCFNCGISTIELMDTNAFIGTFTNLHAFIIQWQFYKFLYLQIICVCVDLNYSWEKEIINKYSQLFNFIHYQHDCHFFLYSYFGYSTGSSKIGAINTNAFSGTYTAMYDINIKDSFKNIFSYFRFLI